MTHTQQQVVLEHLNHVSAKACDLIEQGHYAAVAQDWVNGVFVSLTMIGLKTGVWQIGIPKPDETMFVTDQWQEAVNAVVELTAEEVVEHALL